jgi:colanic acid/amylovoran biosynthesis glycosyltransferase
MHSLPVWLPRTSTWLHALITHLPDDIESHVACESIAHLDQFPVQRLYVLKQESLWRYSLYRLSRRFAWRAHLAYSAEQASKVGARVLHSHWGDVAWKDQRGAIRYGLRQAVTFYGKDVNYLPRTYPVWQDRYRKLFETVRAVFCEGTHMGKVIAALGCPRERIHVIHLGVDTRTIAYVPRHWQEGEPFRILMAASFREKKGLPYALAAIGELVSQGVDIEATVIGDASGDPRSWGEKTTILETIRRYHLHRRVRLLGYQPYARLFEEAYRHHLFLSPSVTAADGDTEGGAPVSLIDMAATGMPIVSTTHCDIPEVIVHEKSGLLAAERDVAGLVSNLRWFLDHPGSWEPMLAAGRRRMETEFDVRTQASRLAERYHILTHD